MVLVLALYDIDEKYSIDSFSDDGKTLLFEISMHTQIFEVIYQ